MIIERRKWIIDALFVPHKTTTLEDIKAEGFLVKACKALFILQHNKVNTIWQVIWSGYEVFMWSVILLENIQA